MNPIHRRFRAVVLSSLIAALGACMSAQAPPRPPQPPAPARTIEKGDQSNVDDAKQVLVRTDSEWAALWRQHAPDRPKPKIDFSKEMVLAVFMGSRSNAGFSTTVTATTTVNGALVVQYAETAPPSGAITASVITFPYHIVAMPKSEIRNVKFEKTP